MVKLTKAQSLRRAILNDYTKAARNIELTGNAIDILEKVSTKEAAQSIALLKRSQTKQVDALDTAAAALGAPYPVMW